MTKTVTMKEIYEACDAAGRKAGDEAYKGIMGGCGFAWVNIRASGKFFKFIQENSLGKKNSYESGATIWVYQYGQHANAKYAYAMAFADKLNEFGIVATYDGRLD